jgi:alkaline phosphatase D
VTLGNYRQRQALYKTDPDLQAAHAAAPWVVVWDDHEVDNNYADEIAARAVEQPGFLERRAAAYRAYYENMPLRQSSVPSGPDLQLYRRIRWGRLANLHMLDTRQYRSDQACGDGYQDCPDAADPARSLPGVEQEEWLIEGFRASEARWDIMGQQVFFGRRDNNAGDSNTVSMDAWDGYPASRDRIVQAWQDAQVRNPVVLTGDVHQHLAADLKADFDDPASPVLAGELVATSITSGGDGDDEHPAAPRDGEAARRAGVHGRGVRAAGRRARPAGRLSISPRERAGG